MAGIDDTLKAFIRLGALSMRYAAGWQRRVEPPYCPMHSHPVYELVYHPSGRGATRCRAAGGGTTLEFEAGCVVVYPPDTPHDQRMSAPGEDVCVLLTPADAPAAEALPKLARPVVFAVEGDSYLVRELIALANTRHTRHTRSAPAHKANGRHPASASRKARPARSGQNDEQLAEQLGVAALDRRASALWTALAAQALRGGERGNPAEALAWRARRHIERHGRGIERIAEVAAALEIGPDHLRHVYKAVHGVSMQSDLRRVRLDYAANLLLHSNLPLKTIAAMCGIPGPQYFSTSFKRHTGCTPDAYRRRAQRGEAPCVPAGISRRTG